MEKTLTLLNIMGLELCLTDPSVSTTQRLDLGNKDNKEHNNSKES